MNLRTIDGWHFDADPSDKPDARPPVVTVRKRRAAVEAFHSNGDAAAGDAPRPPRVFRMAPPGETASIGIGTRHDEWPVHVEANAANAANAESTAAPNAAVPSSMPRSRKRSRSGKGYTVFKATHPTPDGAFDAEWQRLSAWADAIARDLEAALEHLRRSPAEA